MSSFTNEAELVRDFFAHSDLLDYLVLRPLNHIRGNWEMYWDHGNSKYEPEENSFAGALNILIDELASVETPESYHANEDVLAQYVIEHLNWPIKKERGRWVGANYHSILEQGGISDIDQGNLVLAASGRIRAALHRRQYHFDDMETSHRFMLAAVLSIILYCRADGEK